MSKHPYYCEIEGNPVPCGAKQWASLTDDDRRVAYTEFNGCRYSTVFLGYDHNFGPGAPILYETMVFPGESWTETYGERYRSREEAKAGHYRKLIEDGWAGEVPA